MKIYLDNCCFNRPFDDQSQIRIKLETEAKLKIQEDIRSGAHLLVWSYILDYENRQNPFRERQQLIGKWRNYSVDDISENTNVLRVAGIVQKYGIANIDSLHIACAIEANADYILTTDDGILKRAAAVTEIKIADPIGFIKEEPT